MAQPKIVEITLEEQTALMERLQNRDQTDADNEMIRSLFESHQWLLNSIQEKSISISRLQTLIFGQPSKNRKKIKSHKESPDESLPDCDHDAFHDDSAKYDGSHDKPQRGKIKMVFK